MPTQQAILGGLISAGAMHVCVWTLEGVNTEKRENDAAADLVTWQL